MNRNFSRVFDIYSAAYHEKDFSKCLRDDNILMEAENAMRKLLKAEKGGFPVK